MRDIHDDGQPSHRDQRLAGQRVRAVPGARAAAPNAARGTFTPG